MRIPAGLANTDPTSQAAEAMENFEQTAEPRGEPRSGHRPPRRIEKRHRILRSDLVGRSGLGRGVAKSMRPD